MMSLFRRLLGLSESTDVEDRNDAVRDQAISVIERANEETRAAVAVIRDLTGKTSRSALGNSFAGRQGPK